MAQAHRADPRFLGATCIIRIDGLRLAVSSTVTRKVTIVDSRTLDILGDSGDLGSEPGALLTLDRNLWVVLANGSVAKLSSANSPVLALTVVANAASNAWITSVSGTLVVPGRTGEFVFFNSGGSILAIPDSGPAPFRLGLANNGFLYCLCDNGTGKVFAVSSTGTASYLADFLIPGCRDPKDMKLDGSTIVVANATKTFVLSLANPGAPVVSSSQLYNGNTLRGVAVLSAGHQFLASDRPLEIQQPPFPWAETACVADQSLYVAHAAGRLSGYNPAHASDGTLVTMVENGGQVGFDVTPFINALVFDDTVYGVAVSDTMLYVCGAFKHVTDRSGIKARDGLVGVSLATGLITAFTGNGSGTAYKVAVDTNGKLWVACSQARGTAGSRALERYTNDVLDVSFNPAFSFSDLVALQQVGDYMFIGGSFVTPDSRVISFNIHTDVQGTSAGITSGGGPGFGADGSLLYVLGNGYGIQSTTRAGGFAVTVNGVLQPWNPNVTASNQFFGASDGTILYLAGYFSAIQGHTRGGVGAIRLDDGTITSWYPFTGGVKVAYNPETDHVYVAINGAVGSEYGCGVADRFGNAISFSPGITSTGSPTVNDLAFYGSYIIGVGAFTNTAGGFGIFMKAAV